MQKMEKLENDPTVLMCCEWEEDGYHQLETGWTLGGKIGRIDCGGITPMGTWGQGGGVRPAWLRYRGQGRSISGGLDHHGFQRFLTSENKE